MGSNPSRTCWLHLLAEVFNLTAPAPVSSMEDETVIKLTFSHSFISEDMKYEKLLTHLLITLDVCKEDIGSGVGVRHVSLSMEISHTDDLTL